MFIVKKHESTNKSIRMPNDLIEALEKIAVDKELSFSALVVQCCQYALNDMEEEPKA